MWCELFEQLLEAMKEVEYQKEYEMYLRKIFTTADIIKNGYLFLNEFTLLLKQLNISMEEAEVEKVFTEANNDQNMIEGKLVLDQVQFLKFYHNLLDRPEITQIFQEVSSKYKGLAVTPLELQDFMIKEQGYNMSIEECKEIIRDYEIKDDNILSRVTNLYLGPRGFQKFLRSSSLFTIENRSDSLTHVLYYTI